jgi:hypothetical protein
VGDWVGGRRSYHSGRSCRTILRIPSVRYIRFNNVPPLQPRRTRLPAVLELRHLVLLPPLTSPFRRHLHLPIDSISISPSTPLTRELAQSTLLFTPPRTTSHITIGFSDDLHSLTLPSLAASETDFPFSFVWERIEPSVAHDLSG